MTATDDMDVQMVNTLSTMRTIIDNQAETARHQAFLMGNLLSREHQMAQKFLLVLSRIAQTVEAILVLWNHQKVNRALRVDVAEGQANVILVDDVRWNLLRNQLVEEGRRVRIDRRISRSSSGCCINLCISSAH